ncbi:MAG: PLP-dependent transferase [Opitutaceae bacterium]
MRLVPRPLGERIPNKLHAVSCSLPTMGDVVGYETKQPEIIAQICSGYPRFVVHDLIRETTNLWRKRLGLDSEAFWLTASRQVAGELVAWLTPAEARVIDHDGIWGVAHPGEVSLILKARQFLQHTGGFLSSRQAEDHLVAAGMINRTHEDAIDEDPDSRIRRSLAREFHHSDADTIVLTNSGMNAVHRAFHAASARQRARGRTVWIQLGWLYLDTMALMEKLGNGPAEHRVILRVDDLAALREVVRECGPRLAGLVTEAPSNPLIQTPALAEVADLIHSAGGLMIVDPSVASAYNVDVSPYADLLVTSLTKYAAWEGDVIAGAVLLAESCPDREQFLKVLTRERAPLYHRDAARLAHQVDQAPSVVRLINEQTREVARFLSSHRSVKRVFWAESPEEGDRFSRIRRPDGGPGALLTIDLDVPLESFYDRVVLSKGPSFGITTSLLCPFLYLAHYDLVSTERGRQYLQANRMNPELIRVSVGTEPLDSILSALDEAL